MRRLLLPCVLLFSVGSLADPITDPQTTRQWSTTSPPVLWTDAEYWCAKQGANWRLPTKVEAEGMFRGGALRQPFANDMPSDGYLWTGEGVVGIGEGAGDHRYVVNLYNGHAFNGQGYSARVRCVNREPIPDAKQEVIAQQAQDLTGDVIDPAVLQPNRGHARGPDKAPVTIVAFTDLQCPYCSRADDTLKTLMQRRPGQLRVVYRQFPLAFHKGAEPAHRAALAAGKQGKFLEYFDRIMADQSRLRDDTPVLEAWFAVIAKDLGLNPMRFLSDYRSPVIAQEVQADIDLGRLVGVSGTPCFFVQGRRVVGAQGVEVFDDHVKQVLGY